MNKILTTFLISAILLTTFASAVVYETNYVYDQDGNELTDVSVIMYKCQDEVCETASRLWPATMNTENDNTIVLTYPGVPSDYGYITYYFKQGYVPYFVTADWYGQGHAGEFDNILEKIENGIAEINNYDISDRTIKINQELIVTTEIESPSELTTNYFIPEQIDQILKDEVTVSLIIEKDGNVVETVEEITNIDWSSEKDFEISWTPTEKGDYTITLTTEITDDKYLNSEIESRTFDITVSGTQDPNDNDDDEDEDKDNKYPTGYKDLSEDDTTELDQYLNQYNDIIPQDEQTEKELSLWQRFINWFNDLFYKIFWFLD